MAKKITKTTRKKTASKNSDVASKESIQTQNNNEMPSQLSKSNKKMVLAVLVVALLFYYLRDWFVAALVNGRPIMRYQVTNELEKQAGKQALDSLITKSLIEDEAKKRNIVITEKQINDEISKIDKQLKEQGQSLDEVLKLQGTSRKEVMEQTEIQLMVEKILEDKIQVSDKEVDEAFETDKDSFPTDLSEEEIKKQLKESLASQKFSAELQTFLDELKKKATINYIKPY